MSSNNYKWEGAGTPLPSGHTIIETHNHAEGARWAIFDESGKTPETTADGILWLDQDWTLGTNFEAACWVPVKRDEDGERFSVPVDTATLLYLSRMFRWTIEDVDHGRFYNAK